MQTYYFDAGTGLQRRVDYSPEVTGKPLTAHYTSEHRDFGGLPVPARRRVLRRDTGGVADHQATVILLDVHDLKLENGTVQGKS